MRRPSENFCQVCGQLVQEIDGVWRHYANNADTNDHDPKVREYHNQPISS